MKTEKEKLKEEKEWNFQQTGQKKSRKRSNYTKPKKRRK